MYISYKIKVIVPNEYYESASNMDLLQGEHMLVKELLELLVDIVNADLLETVVVKDLKASDVKDTNVGDLLHRGVAQGLVTLVHLFNFFV